MHKGWFALLKRSFIYYLLYIAEFWCNTRLICWSNSTYKHINFEQLFLGPLLRWYRAYILSAEMRSPVHTEVRLWLWYCMRWPWCLSRTPFNQWAASSSSNYCSGSPSPSLGNLSITHFHFFPGSHKSLVLSLLQSPSKRPRGSLDTCVNNRWQVCPPSSKGSWRRERVYIFLLLHWLNRVAVCLHTSCFCAYLYLSLCFLPVLLLPVSLFFCLTLPVSPSVSICAVVSLFLSL